MGKKTKIAFVGHECVACGSCTEVCPKKAIKITSGILAKVTDEDCVGCAKCANVCPAGVITIQERRILV